MSENSHSDKGKESQLWWESYIIIWRKVNVIWELDDNFFL